MPIFINRSSRYNFLSVVRFDWVLCLSPVLFSGLNTTAFYKTSSEGSWNFNSDIALAVLYDLKGNRLLSETYSLDNRYLDAGISVAEDLKAGFYILLANAGDQSFTLRLMKN